MFTHSRCHFFFYYVSNLTDALYRVRKHYGERLIEQKKDFYKSREHLCRVWRTHFKVLMSGRRWMGIWFLKVLWRYCVIPRLCSQNRRTGRDPQKSPTRLTTLSSSNHYQPSTRWVVAIIRTQHEKSRAPPTKRDDYSTSAFKLKG